MAVVFRTGSSAVGEAAAFSFSHSPGGNDRALLVGMIFADPLGDQQGVIGATFAGLPLELVPLGGVAGTAGVELYRLVAPPVGAANVVINLSATCRAALVALSYEGVHQTTPWGVSAGAGGTSTTAAVTTPVTETGGLVVDVVGAFGDATALGGTPHGGQTKRVEQESGGTVARSVCLMGDDVSGGAVALAWTLTAAAPWRHIALELRAAPAGGVRARGRLGGGIIRRPGRIRASD